MFHYLIFAQDARAARECALKNGIPYHMYSYVMSSDILNQCNPKYTRVVFDPTWTNRYDSAELFDVAFAKGLITEEGIK